MKVNQVCIQVKRIAQAPCAWWKHCIDITQGREIAKKPVWSEFWTRSLTKIMRQHISTLYYQIKVNENGLDIILINIPEPVLILLLKNIYFFLHFYFGGNRHKCRVFYHIDQHWPIARHKISIWRSHVNHKDGSHLCFIDLVGGIFDWCHTYWLSY